jgi:hypothetical protein
LLIFNDLVPRGTFLLKFRILFKYASRDSGERPKIAIIAPGLIPGLDNTPNPLYGQSVESEAPGAEYPASYV